MWHPALTPGSERVAILLSEALRVLLRPPALATADSARLRLDAATTTAAVGVDIDHLVLAIFNEHGPSLVRLARLFTDDRNAAEDLVQEAFIRLARSAHRIQDPAKTPAYLRSIVLNLARDHNRRGFVSLRHHLPLDDRVASVEDEIALREDQRQIIEALRDLPHRQRDCLFLRYYEELGVDEIADALQLSRNSVKTHLQRGLRTLEMRLAAAARAAAEAEAVAW